MVVVKVVLKNRVEFVQFSSMWAAKLRMQDYAKCADVIRVEML